VRITAVEESKNLKGKLLVYIDGSYSFTISQEDYFSLNLYEDKELTGDDIDYIRNIVIFRAAKNTAIKYLSLKMRSSGEVYRKLKDEGYGDDVIGKVIEELKSMGYINDQVYAGKFINDRMKLKPKSKKMLKMELQNKGIDEDVINEALNEAEIDDLQTAKQLLVKKFGNYDLKDEKVRRKAYTYLYNRGFGYNLADRIINSLSERQRS